MITLSEYGILRNDQDGCGRGCGSFNNRYENNEWCHAKPHVWTSIVNSRPKDVTKCTTDRTCAGKLKDCWSYDIMAIKYCIKVMSNSSPICACFYLFFSIRH